MTNPLPTSPNTLSISCLLLSFFLKSIWVLKASVKFGSSPSTIMLYNDLKNKFSLWAIFYSFIYIFFQFLDLNHFLFPNFSLFCLSFILNYTCVSKYLQNVTNTTIPQTKNYYVDYYYIILSDTIHQKNLF